MTVSAQLGSNQATVAKAVHNVPDVELLLTQLNQIEGEFLALVWRGILDVTDCPKQYGYLSALQQDLDDKPVQERDELLAIMRLSRSQIVLAQNQCAVRAAKSDQAPQAILQMQIERIEEVAASAPAVTAEQLTKDKTYFESILTTQ